MNQLNKIGYLLATLVIVLAICYTYNKGLQDGEWNYKHSHRIYLALKCAYNYGYEDCQAGRPNDWDGN